MIVPGWLILAALFLLYPLFQVEFDRYQYVPFMIGLVLVGLPHGAMDHLVIPHVKQQKLRPIFLAAFIIVYTALVLLYLVFWHFWPIAALALFLMLSWLHWGQGDSYYLRSVAARSAPGTVASLLLIWAVRGALPILLPPLQFPIDFQRFCRGILHWYAPQAAVWQINPTIRAVGIGVITAFVVLYLFVSWIENGGRGGKAFWIDAGEIVILYAVFSYVPPVLAVGVYFCVWHSWRHIARLMLADRISERLIADGRIGQALWRTALQSLPMTLGALFLLSALYATHDHRTASTGDFVYLYLSLIAALTFPHFVLVLWMDWKQGAWRVVKAASETIREQLI